MVFCKLFVWFICCVCKGTCKCDVDVADEADDDDDDDEEEDEAGDDETEEWWWWSWLLLLLFCSIFVFIDIPLDVVCLVDCTVVLDVVFVDDCCWSFDAQHTLNTTFILFVRHRPPIRRCKSSFDDVANYNENKLIWVPIIIHCIHLYSHIK